MEQDEFKESTTIRFDWTIRGVKDLFDSTFVYPLIILFLNILIFGCSKGDGKSKVWKSVKFGGGHWQVRRSSRLHD